MWPQIRLIHYLKLWSQRLSRRICLHWWEQVEVTNIKIDGQGTNVERQSRVESTLKKVSSAAQQGALSDRSVRKVKGSKEGGPGAWKRPSLQSAKKYTSMKTSNCQNKVAKLSYIFFSLNFFLSCWFLWGSQRRQAISLWAQQAGKTWEAGYYFTPSALS